MSLTGYDHITGHHSPIITDHKHWRINAYKNLGKVVKLILLFSCSEKPLCIFCGKHSLNYNSLASLAAHYRDAHKHQCVSHYLDEIIKIEPEKIKRLYEKNRYDKSHCILEAV